MKHIRAITLIKGAIEGQAETNMDSKGSGNLFCYRSSVCDLWCPEGKGGAVCNCEGGGFPPAFVDQNPDASVKKHET